MFSRITTLAHKRTMITFSFVTDMFSLLAASLVRTGLNKAQALVKHLLRRHTPGPVSRICRQQMAAHAQTIGDEYLNVG